MVMNQYGITKNGKILLKYGFIAIDVKLSQKENEHNWHSLKKAVEKEDGQLFAEIPDGILNGTVTSIDCGNGIAIMFCHAQTNSVKVTRFYIDPDTNTIRSEVQETVKREIRVSADVTLTAVPDVVYEYLEEHFKEAKTVTRRNGVDFISWDLRGARRAPMKRHVWQKYQEWIRESLSKRFIVNGDGEQCGISLEDITLRLFLGNEYPIQPDGFEKPLKAAELAQAQNNLKQVITTKRQEIETKCFSKAITEQEWRNVFWAISAWVMTGSFDGVNI